jgi:outer membrane protein assembly factor BamB
MAFVTRAALGFALLFAAACSDGGAPSSAVAAASAGQGAGAAAGGADPGFDWPTFLGPDHTGVSRETGLLQAWPEKGPPLVWKAELGETYAVPSVVRGWLVLFHRVGDEEVVEALDPATGRKKWRFAYGTRYVDQFGYNGGPRSAPTIDGGKAYTLGAEGKLHCLELETGKPLWSRSLHEEYFKEERQNFFGVGVAPRIDGDAILLNLGDDRQGCVTAIDKKTGKTLWRAGEDGASYSTAVCATVGKSRLALFLTREGGLAVGVEDGKVRWTYPFRSRERFSANAASPVVIGDRLFLTATYGVGSALLKLEEDGVKELWRNHALGAHWATPIHEDGYVYGFDGRHDHEAELRCVRLSDGQVQWSRKGYQRGSKIRAEGKYVILSEDGRLVLAELTPKECREISSVRVLASHCWAAPVLSRGLLYVTNFNHRTGKGELLCLDLRAK